MTLLEKQQAFSRMVTKLIQRANDLGYDVTLGEAWRSPETAELMKKAGKGIKNTNHTVRLAIDINLYYRGAWLDKTEQHAALGKWWELQSTELYTCIWGGRFGDGNHYSFEHNGVK